MSLDLTIPHAALQQGGDPPLAGLMMEILRRKGEFVRISLDYGNQGQLALGLLALTFMAGLIYGLIMGYPGGWRQSLASSVKTPLLFALTLAICFPALFAVQILLGSQLGLLQTLNVLLFALAFNAVLLASFAPIAGLFGLGSSYHFMKILHVILFTLCGWTSMGVLQHGLTMVGGSNGAIPAQGLRLFQLWVVIYGFAGTQMAWMMRPFLGEPKLPFELFRHSGQGLNFYSAVWLSLLRLAPARTGSGGGAKAEAYALAEPNRPAAPEN